MRRGAWLLVLLAGTADVAACSCADVVVEERLDRAKTIALVRIRQVEINPAWRNQLDDAYQEASPLRAEAEVVEVLRGTPRSPVWVMGGFGAGGCSVPLLPGEDVLLVDVAQGDEFELHLCSASRLLGVGSLLEAAGKPAPRSLDRLYLQAVRDYLVDGTPLHACLRGGVPPPPPPPDADPADAEWPDCRTLLERSPGTAR
jgi:hypothetical protein